VLQLLWDVHVAQWRPTGGMGGQLGAEALKSHLGLCILWLNASSCIHHASCYRFHFIFETRTFHHIELHVVTQESM
jgi:hypothetical protein